MKILVVDDSRAMRMIVIRALKAAGYSSHTFQEASNGKEAWDAIQAEKPDLVLSDWNMPEMRGIDLLKTIKEAGVEVPFGFVTSEASSAVQQEASDNGALFFITKPFTNEAFEDALGPVLAK